MRSPYLVYGQLNKEMQEAGHKGSILRPKKSDDAGFGTSASPATKTGRKRDDSNSKVKRAKTSATGFRVIELFGSLSASRFVRRTCANLLRWRRTRIILNGCSRNGTITDFGSFETFESRCRVRQRCTGAHLGMKGKENSGRSVRFVESERDTFGKYH